MRRRRRSSLRRHPDVRRDLRVRPREARAVVGIRRGLGLRRRQARELRGDGADLRGLRRSAGLGATRRDPGGGRPRRGQLVRHHADGRSSHGSSSSSRCSRSPSPSPPARSRRMPPAGSSPAALWADGWYGILQAGGLLFFAFAGYARIATMGEEVRDPARTIPRAIVLAFAGAVVVYAAVASRCCRPSARRRPRHRPSRSRTPSARRGGAGRSPSSGSARPRHPSALSSPSSPASAGPRSRWRARATCRGSWPPSTRAGACRIAPRSRRRHRHRRRGVRRHPRRDRLLVVRRAAVLPVANIAALPPATAPRDAIRDCCRSSARSGASSSPSPCRGRASSAASSSSAPASLSGGPAPARLRRLTRAA